MSERWLKMKNYLTLLLCLFLFVEIANARSDRRKLKKKMSSPIAKCGGERLILKLDDCMCAYSYVCKLGEAKAYPKMSTCKIPDGSSQCPDFKTCRKNDGKGIITQIIDPKGVTEGSSEGQGSLQK